MQQPNSPNVSNVNIPNKRPHSAIESLSESDNDFDSEDVPITGTCNAIRRKINSLMNSGEMKVTEFQRLCNINSNSYGRFMKLEGPYAGDMNQTYAAAFRLFKLRDAADIKEPTKKKVKKDEESRKLDVSGVVLAGEGDESVEVYDTCDNIRRKIVAYLREPNITQAAFLRELAKALPDPKDKLQSKQLKNFQTKKGPLAGNTSRIYYVAYVFSRSSASCRGSRRARREQKTRTFGLAVAVSIEKDKAISGVLRERGSTQVNGARLVSFEVRMASFPRLHVVFAKAIVPFVIFTHTSEASVFFLCSFLPSFHVQFYFIIRLTASVALSVCCCDSRGQNSLAAFCRTLHNNAFQGREEVVHSSDIDNTMTFEDWYSGCDIM